MFCFPFPIALLIIYGLDVFFSQNLAIERSDKLLKDLDPFKSKAILHACIAGFYLFISGIISGNIGNNSVFYQIPERIAKSISISRLFGKNLPKDYPNITLKTGPELYPTSGSGYFLGNSSGRIILRTDLDIRHITFAAGNLALGFTGKISQSILIPFSFLW
jgi:site-specific recombinase